MFLFKIEGDKRKPGWRRLSAQTLAEAKDECLRRQARVKRGTTMLLGECMGNMANVHVHAIRRPGSRSWLPADIDIQLWQNKMVPRPGARGTLAQSTPR